jgi:hypothetical protein
MYAMGLFGDGERKSVERIHFNSATMSFIAMEPQRSTGVSPAAKRTFLGLIAFMAATKLLLVALSVKGILASQDVAFSWLSIGVLAALGWGALFLAARAGLPDLWDPAVSVRARFGVPALLGVIFGVIQVLGDLGRTDALSAFGGQFARADIHKAFPTSLPFYLYGAVFAELLLRLIAMTLLFWMLGRVVLRGKKPLLAFWAANVVTSLLEVWPYIVAGVSDAPRLAKPGAVVHALMGPLFATNLVAGWLYRRSGFLAAVVLRVAVYLVWHIGYGSFRSFWNGL